MTIRVQTELTRLGYYKGKIDGNMGPDIKEALRAFQRAQGLSATGTMDNVTLANLGITG
jgi:His-Xaa-Ser repeat protein HxsA